jgi:adenine-specific DNA methylase
MIPKACKRLAEVDFPIAEVSRHAAREKSIRHGHPSTLHLWWARRPLASCRAVLLALLWPDPCDPLCPPAFKAEARKRLREVPGCNPGATDEDLRHALLKFIADFANWDVAANPTYLDVSRALVKAAHAPEDGSPYEPPLVVDPFAGGGSIPLEALRAGCDAFASDLNPVACLILKVMLEDIPRHGPTLAEELRRVGAEIKQQAEKELAYLYPKDPDGATPIAYLWARTVKCEAPNCGAEIPLARSFWLCKKANRRRALRHRVERPRGEPPRVAFEVFEPKTEKNVPAGTVTRAKAKCLCCGTVLAPERVRAQLAAQRGGADVVFDAKGQRIGGARLLAVVTLRPGETGRHYRLPNERDYEAVRKAQARVAKLLADWERGGRQGLCPVPDEPLPPIGTLGFRVQRYGMLQWGDLFTARQKVSFVSLGQRTAGIAATDAARTLMAMVCTKLSDRCNSLVNWSLGVECPNQLFKGNAVPMAWDFAESNLLSDSSASVEQSVDNVARNAEVTYIPGAKTGSTYLVDAQAHPLPDQAVAAWFTDPPYYDAVPYSDLSDFFFVWFKRSLLNLALLHDPFDPENPLTPKRQEAVQDETKCHDGRRKDRAWFEEAMAKAFAEGHRVLREDGVGSVVFAHKTTEGWEALLSGMIRGGWTITGSWPIATERYSRLRARESAALATSVHLICRPRPDDAGVGDWADVLRELPVRVADWMERLQREGVRGADLVFACIGPALEIFSRYARVETAEGREVKLDEYLAKVWEVVGRAALAQVLGTAEARARNGAAGAVEEDARLTALFLWTLQATDGEGAEDAGGEDEDDDDAEDDEDEGGSGRAPKGYTLVFDVVRRFAQPLGIELPKWEGRVIETKKGVVRLLPVAERARQLFGEDGAAAVATRLERTTTAGTNPLQGLLFPETEAVPNVRGARGRGRRVAVDVSDESLAAAREATTLDRVHAAMLLQAGGRTNALRALLTAEQERGPDFLRLANALSALYPKASEEKRLLDAMLLAVPR